MRRCGIINEKYNKDERKDMQYSNKQILELENEFKFLYPNFVQTKIDLNAKLYLDNYLKNDTAKEIGTYGICRRLGHLRHWYHKIYEIYPPNRTTILSDEECIDLTAFIQSIFINIYGIIDNIAVIIDAENKLNMIPHQISLDKQLIKDNMPSRFKTYFYSEKIQAWYRNHMKQFRNSLVHREPLYVVPYLRVFKDETQQQYEDKPAPFYAHSFSKNPRQVLLHCQIIVDCKTVLELVRALFDIEYTCPLQLKKELDNKLTQVNLTE